MSFKLFLSHPPYPKSSFENENHNFILSTKLFFLLTIFLSLAIISIQTINADVISLNSGGGTEIAVTPDKYLEGFFFGVNPAPVCGNSVVESGEQCDDGNVDNGDGCDANCIIENGPVCGNDIVETNEQCDDGEDNGVRCDNDNEDCSYCTNSCSIKELDEDDDSDDDDDDENLLLSFAGGCTPNWECGAWSECDSGVMGRDCIDTNECYLEINKPSETTKCTVQVLVDEEEKQSNNYWLWVIAALLVLIIVILFNFKNF